MAHQFSALHNAPFVAVSHTTRERLRQVNITALGLITEMTAHVDGFPVTLDTIIKRTKKPGAAALREAYQELIEERLLVYIRYTLQIPGQRPYQSSTTVIAREAITDAEFGERIAGKATPGQFIFDQQPDGEVRKVKILSATVRYWGGEKKINGDGVLVAPGPKKKPGPKKGTRSGQQPTAPPATNSVEEPGTRSSSMSRENERDPQGIEEPGTRSSSMSRENGPSAQGNEELGDEESSLPGSLTRPGDKTTNQTTGQNVDATADESAGSDGVGWLESSAEDDGEGNGGGPSAGYTLLTDLGVKGTPRSQWAETVTNALHVLGPTPVGTQLAGGKTTPGPGAIVQTRLPGLAEQLVQARQKPKQAAGASSGSATVWPTWCGGCERDDRRYENGRGAWVKCPSCHPYGNDSGDAAFLDKLSQMAGDAA